MTTPASIISVARSIINDVDPTLYRQADSELLGYFNDGMQEISVLVPSVFSSIGDLTCTVGSVEQTVTFNSAQAIIDILCIHGSTAITPFDWDIMNRFNPGWRTDTAGPAKQWVRKQGDPLRFFIYPQSPSTAQVIDVMYVRNPIVLALTDTITEIPAGYYPALVDYIVYRAESKDDESVVSQRSAGHYQTFVAKVKGA
tara:strand:- start:2021 stop:2617 length:597 start_codon:yes stop_codon:yes gene_type:complete